MSGGGGSGDGEVALTPRTESAHNFSFSGTIQTGQNRDLFDTNITLPTDLADAELFIIRLESDNGEANVHMTKAHLEELAVAAPVTWSTSATGTTGVLTGATKNVYYHPLGQNRGIFIGRSNETPQRLLWGWSNAQAVDFTLQLVTVTAGSGSLPGGEASDTTVAPSNGEFDETTIAVPTGTWGYVNFGNIGTFRLGEWHRFLVADLTGLTAANDNAMATTANALTFQADEETYFYLGRTTGGNVLVGTSNGSVIPGTVRIRTN